MASSSDSADSLEKTIKKPPKTRLTTEIKDFIREQYDMGVKNPMVIRSELKKRNVGVLTFAQVSNFIQRYKQNKLEESQTSVAKLSSNEKCFIEKKYEQGVRRAGKILEEMKKANFSVLPTKLQIVNYIQRYKMARSNKHCAKKVRLTAEIKSFIKDKYDEGFRNAADIVKALEKQKFVAPTKMQVINYIQRYKYAELAKQEEQRNLNDEVKRFIREIYDEGVTKSADILANLKKRNYNSISMTQVSNYVQRYKRSKMKKGKELKDSQIIHTKEEIIDLCSDDEIAKQIDAKDVEIEC